MKFRLSTLLVVLALCCATMGLFVRNLWAVIFGLDYFFRRFPIRRRPLGTQIRLGDQANKRRLEFSTDSFCCHFPGRDHFGGTRFDCSALILRAADSSRIQKFLAESKSKSNHCYTNEELSIRSIIPPNAGRPTKKPAKGKQRRQMQKRFDKKNTVNVGTAKP